MSRATPLAGPNLLVAVKLSSGMSNASLAGPYHFASHRLESAPRLLASTDFGTATADGIGGLTISANRHEVMPNGGTTDFPVAGAGSYSIAPDGTLTDSGGAQGALSSDGEIGFLAQTSGLSAALRIVVRKGSACDASLLAGEWGYGNFKAKPSLVPLVLCEYSWEFGGGPFTATGPGTASYSLAGEEGTLDQSGSGVSPIATTGTATVNPDGTLFLLETGSAPPGEPGALSGGGDFALGTALETGSASLTLAVRKCPWPSGYGTGTAGTGGLVPALGPSGGFPNTGNGSFGVAATNALGGSICFFGLSLLPAPGIPVAGGTAWIDPGTLIFLLGLPLSGPAGVPGAGSSTLPVAIPPGPSLDGFTACFQGFVIDPGASQGISMTPGLAVAVCR